MKQVHSCCQLYTVIPSAAALFPSILKLILKIMIFKKIFFLTQLVILARNCGGSPGLHTGDPFQKRSKKRLVAENVTISTITTSETCSIRLGEI